jgi:hypothetical protein
MMGRGMNDLFKEAVGCERRAVRCGAEAIATANPILRDLLFDIEDRWVALAESYRIAQQAMEAEDLPRS